MKATPRWAILQPMSQKRRRNSGMPRRSLPAYSRRIQRINRPQVWASIAPKIASDTLR